MTENDTTDKLAKIYYKIQQIETHALRAIRYRDMRPLYIIACGFIVLSCLIAYGFMTTQDSLKKVLKVASMPVTVDMPTVDKPGPLAGSILKQKDYSLEIITALGALNQSIEKMSAKQNTIKEIVYKDRIIYRNKYVKKRNAVKKKRNHISRRTRK